MKHLLVNVIAILISLNAVFAQGASELHIKNYNLDNGLALQGYDPVAYFNKLEAVEGNKQISFMYSGATYYFSSPGNREEFKKDRAKYEPQYGGWCAYAMGAKGAKVSIDPATFKIIAGKLYLFYNHFFNNTRTSWNKDESNLKDKADANWLKIIAGQ